MKKAYIDLRAGVILIVASLTLYFVLIPAQIRTRPSAGILPADFFPRLLAIMLGVCGLLLVGSKLCELRQNREMARQERAGGEWKVEYKAYLPHAIFLIMAIVYLVLMQYLGFILTSIPFLVFLFWHFGHPGIVANIALSVVYVPIVYYIFSTWFHIRFPIGPFGF